jgi:hypothetical protein
MNYLKTLKRNHLKSDRLPVMSVSSCSLSLSHFAVLVVLVFVANWWYYAIQLSVRDDSPAHTIRLPCDLIWSLCCFGCAAVIWTFCFPWYDHFLILTIFSSWPFSHLCRKEGELKEGWRRLSNLGKYLISEGDMQWGIDQCPKLNVVFLVCWSRSLMNQYFVVLMLHACPVVWTIKLGL